MAKYQAPEGYVLDDNTGLYYTQVVVEDDAGNMAQVVTWFDANTGEYRQDVYPINKKDETKKIKKKVWPIIFLIVLLVAAGALAYWYFTKVNNGEGTSKSDSEAAEATGATENVVGVPDKPDGLIEIFVYDDGYATLVCHTDLLEGPHVKHLTFYLGDYSVSVNDWDDGGSITQCSIWKKDENPGENTSYSFLADATYNINGPVIAIDADLGQIEDLDMTSLIGDIFVQAEYYEEGHNYYYSYDINEVVSFVFRNGN